MNKKKIGLFIILNFGISWLIGILGILFGIKALSTSYFYLAVIYMFIPAISAIIVKKFIYKEEIIKYFGLSFKINKWFFIAWIMPLLIAFGSLFIALLFSDINFSSNMVGFLSKYKEILSPNQFSQLQNQLLSSNIPVGILISFQAILAGLTVNALAGLGEELGWRGFLQKELFSLGFWRSSFLIGFIWGIWHTPLILMGHNYPNNPYLGIVLMTLLGIFLGPVFSFFRLKAKSVIAAAISHGTFNASLSLSTIFLKGGNELTIGMTGLSGLIVLIMINILIYLYLKHKNFSHEERLSV